MINQAVHTLDLLSDLLGKPDWIDASLSNHHLKGLIEVEDMLEAYIRFGEKVACFYATNAYCADVPPLIEISCEKVTVRIEDLDVFLSLSGWNDYKARGGAPCPNWKKLLGKRSYSMYWRFL